MARMHPMKSMALTPSEKMDAILPMPMEREDYPYGLRLCLTDAELEKMELDPADACVGGLIHLHAMGRITSISSNDVNGKKCQRIELQIEDLCVESEDEENEEMDSPLYDRTKKD